MLLETGDMVKITFSPWDLRSLKESFPDQVPDDAVYGNNPISTIAEVGSIYRKKEQRAYALRFTSGHTLEVTDEFIIRFCLRLGKNVNVKGDELKDKRGDKG